MGSREKWLLIGCLVLLAVVGPLQVEAQLWPQVPLWDIYIRDNHHRFGSHLKKRQGEESTTEEDYETTTQLALTADFTTPTNDVTSGVYNDATYEDETTQSSFVGSTVRTIMIAEPESLLRGSFKKRPPCGAAFSLTSFTLLPPAPSQREPEETKCSFTVQRPVKTICKLHLKFNSFEFSEQESEGEACENGLTFNGHAFCGNLTGTSQLIEFNPASEDLNLEFDTTNMDKDVFYNVTVRQIDCRPELTSLSSPKPEQFETQDDDLETYGQRSSPPQAAEPKVDRNRVPETEETSCLRNTDAREFLVQSPNFPEEYPNNKDCVVTVYPSGPNICSLELRFDEFRVEPSPYNEDCENDYLEISDDEPLSQPLKYCGIFAGVRLVEMGRVKRFTFHSNEQISDIGYSIFVKQIQCIGSETTEGTTEETSGGRTTPSTTTTTTEDFPVYTTPPKIAEEFPVYNVPPQIADEFPIFNNPPQIADEFPIFIKPPQIAEEFPVYNVPPQIAVEFPVFNPASPTSTTPSYIEDTYYPAVITPAPKSDDEFPDSSNFPGVVDRHPTKPSFCDRTLTLSEPVRISSPNFPNKYLDNESCNYFLQVTQNNICFVKINFLSFVLKSSAGCREDYLEISGSRICGSQVGSVLFPVDKTSKTTKLTFVSNGSGREQGFDIEVSQVSCDLQLRDPDDIVIVGGSPPGSTYGSPTGNPAFNPGPEFNPSLQPTGSDYDAPTIFENPNSGEFPAGSGYGSPSNFPNTVPGFNPNINQGSSAESGYDSPNVYPNSGFNPTQIGGSGLVFSNPDSTEIVVDSYGSPIGPVDSIFYGSTQGSSFGKQPNQNPASVNNGFSNNPFIPSLQIGGSSDVQAVVVGSSEFVDSSSSQNNQPTTQIQVVEDVDSYGAPQGPIISVFDPPRPNLNFEPEIITGRPNFVNPDFNDQHRPNFNNPTFNQGGDSQFDGHRPNFNNPSFNQGGDSQFDGHRPNFNNPTFNQGGDLQFDGHRPNFNDPTFNQDGDSQFNGHRPNFNQGGDSQFDGHRPNLNNPPVQTSRPPFNEHKPNYNQPSDGYGAPQAPVLTEKPTYGPPSRPNYKPRPSKGPNFLGPIASIIDAKRQAVANILHGFRSPKNVGGRRPQRPSYRPHPRPAHPQTKPKLPFKFPFNGGFGKPKKQQPVTGRPSYNTPNSGYGVPQGPLITTKPNYNPRPTYNRPPRKINPSILGFLGDPRASAREDIIDQNENDEVPVMKCGESDLVAETFNREFIFRSPGYPDNYPDSANCSVNIFPRKDVCALGLELEDFIMEDSAYCRSDYVAIGGRSEVNKKRICGQQSYRILELATPENYLEPWVLEFKSDSAGHQRGFNIKATQILCSELDLEPFGLFDVDNCGVEELTTVTGIISKQKMIQEEICVYEISKQEGFCSMVVVVEGLTPGSHCTEKFVEINKSLFCITRQKDATVHEFFFDEFGRMEMKSRLWAKTSDAEDWKISFEQKSCQNQNVLLPK